MFKLLITILYFICSFTAFGAGSDIQNKREPNIGFVLWIVSTFFMLMFIWG